VRKDVDTFLDAGRDNAANLNIPKYLANKETNVDLITAINITNENSYRLNNT